jgi:hypothetical protein
MFNVEPAYRALEWIDHSVVVLVEFLELVVQQSCGLRDNHPSRSTIPPVIIPSRLFQHSQMGNIRRDQRLWLNDGHRLRTPLQLLRAGFLGRTR